MRDLCERAHVVTERQHIHIGDELEESALVVYQEHDGVVRINHGFDNLTHTNFLSLFCGFVVCWFTGDGQHFGAGLDGNSQGW